MSWLYLLVIPAVGFILKILLGKYVSGEQEIAVASFVKGAAFWLFSKLTIIANRITAGLWNKLIEPVFKVFLSILLKGLLDGALEGLDSDNNDSKFGRTP